MRRRLTEEARIVRGLRRTPAHVRVDAIQRKRARCRYRGHTGNRLELFLEVVAVRLPLFGRAETRVERLERQQALRIEPWIDCASATKLRSISPDPISRTNESATSAITTL